MLAALNALEPGHRLLAAPDGEIQCRMNSRPRRRIRSLPCSPTPTASPQSDVEKLKELAKLHTVERLFEMDRRMRADAAREAFGEAFARAPAANMAAGTENGLPTTTTR